MNSEAVEDLYVPLMKLPSVLSLVSLFVFSVDISVICAIYITKEKQCDFKKYIIQEWKSDMANAYQILPDSMVSTKNKTNSKSVCIAKYFS